MRLTRAAQRAQQGADEPNDAPDVKERAVLNEISPNASPEQVQAVEDLPKKTPAKKTKAKATKKGAKGKKTKSAETEDEEPIPAVLDDEQPAIDDVVGDAAGEELASGPSAEEPEERVEQERPVTPPSKPVRLTRRQLALLEEEAAALKQSQDAAAAPEEEETQASQEPVVAVEPEIATEAIDSGVEEVEDKPEVILEQNLSPEIKQASVEDKSMSDPLVEQALDQQPKETTGSVKATLPESVEEIKGDSQDLVEATITPSVEVTSEPEPKTLAAEKPSEDCVSTPIASRTSSRRASRSPSKSPMRIEDHFEALDALEEALENVNAVTSFDRPIEEKSPRKKAFHREVEVPAAARKTPSKTPLATRVSKTPNPALRSMKSTTLSKTSASQAASSLARASSLRVAPKQEVRKPSTETTDYLAARRRPVSVSFPTPPPPPKGRAPTKPTFQLSSENVVAKLKAQKEERLKREAEGVPAPKQRPISMPPPPKSSKPVTKPDFKLPGEEIAEKLKARKEERLARLHNGTASPRQSTARPTSMIVQPPKSTKPPTKAAFELPGAAVAEKLRVQREERVKRMEEAEAAKKEAAAKARTAPVRKTSTVAMRQQIGISIPPPPPPATQPAQPQPQLQRSSSIASKRSSVMLSQSRSTSTSSANRNSAVITKSVVTPVDAAAQKVKGREVFNRDKMEKDARERERKEKEDAAKRARAEAAERGRIASREWAEKQRKKLMGGAS